MHEMPKSHRRPIFFVKVAGLTDPEFEILATDLADRLIAAARDAAAEAGDARSPWPSRE